LGARLGGNDGRALGRLELKPRERRMGGGGSDMGRGLVPGGGAGGCAATSGAAPGPRSAHAWADPKE
jgi:hypothetical protein